MPSAIGKFEYSLYASRQLQLYDVCLMNARKSQGTLVPHGIVGTYPPLPVRHLPVQIYDPCVSRSAFRLAHFLDPQTQFRFVTFKC